MLIRQMSGPRFVRAPEDDRGGASDDLDEDFSLDPPDDEDDQQDDSEEGDIDDQDDLDEDDLNAIEDEDEPPARQPSRSENRVARATRDAKEAKERADRLEREMAEIRATLRPQTDNRETPQQRESRLAAMDPYERLQYELQESRQETARTLQRIEFENADNRDKLAYEALAQQKPVAAKLKDEVEKRLAEMRASGTTAPRETVLRWVIGDRALANAGKATSRARKSADRNVERNSARAPAGGRGDAPSEGRRNGTSSRDKRLESYQL